MIDFLISFDGGTHGHILRIRIEKITRRRIKPVILRQPEWNKIKDTKIIYKNKTAVVLAGRILLAVASLLMVAGCGEESIHEAAKNGEAEEVKKLLGNGADMDATGEHSRTPLHMAARKGHLDVVRVLLNHGANVNATDGFGTTPLHFASNFGNELEVVEILIDNGAEVNVTDNNGNTPLHEAATNGQAGVAEILLDHGAEVNARDNDGNTPLHDTTFLGGEQWGNPVRVAKILLDNGGHKTAPNRSGDTPFDVLVSPDNSKLAKVLCPREAEE